jgi:AmmeMemoRadiSam system protein B
MVNDQNNIKNKECTVAGEYYPADVDKLKKIINSSIENYNKINKEKNIKSPFAIITPYEDYNTASKIYGSAYSQISKTKYDSIIIIAPLHKIAFPGIALTKYESFNTPFGKLEIDQESNKKIINYNKEYIVYNDKYHSTDMSIEVQLPYIYDIFKNKIKILPIIIGETNTKFTILLANAISSLIKNNKKKFLIIVTTNLSQQKKYEESKNIDSEFINLLNLLNPDKLSEQLAMRQIQAFGGGGVITLLRLCELLKIKNLKILDYLNTGDVTDDKYKVNGYFSAVFW